MYGNLRTMAESALTRGLYDEAERVFGQAIQSYGNSSDEPEVADCLRGLAKVYLAKGRMAEAEKSANRALAIDEDYWGGGCLQVGESYFLMGEASRYQGELGRSEFFYLESLGHRQAHLGSEHIDVAQARGRLALLGIIHGLYPDLPQLLTGAYRVWQVAPSTSEFIEFIDLKQMLRYFIDQGHRLDADLLYRNSTALLEQVFGRAHHELVSLKQFYGVRSAPGAGAGGASGLGAGSGLGANKAALSGWQQQVKAATVGGDNNFDEKVRLHIANLEYDKAEIVILLQLRLAREKEGEKSPEVRRVLSSYVSLLRRWERHGDAEKIAKLAERAF